MRKVLLALALGAAACATGGARPRFGAAPESSIALLRVVPDTVIVQLDARLRSLGIGVAVAAPREGYLESRWFDLEARADAAPPWNRLDSIVKFRFFADPVQGRTRLLAEAMRRIAWDPSLPERELERMVPDGHPARALLDSVLIAIRADTVIPPPIP